jgi:hypothetical protein
MAKNLKLYEKKKHRFANIAESIELPPDKQELIEIY